MLAFRRLDVELVPAKWLAPELSSDAFVGCLLLRETLMTVN